MTLTSLSVCNIINTRIDIQSVITHCAFVVCYFRDVYPFIYFIIAMYVHHLGLYYILFRNF